jgi:molybdenum cofactor synthesis domain-containing protein
MDKISIVSVNVSERKGTVKKPVEEIVLTQTGIEGDAHAGAWHRQVSLLGTESFDKMQASAGRKVDFGEFAENITTRGFILNRMRPLDRLISKEIMLEVTQIGKKCHGQHCAIFRETGDCVMPKEGIFCRVIQGGRLRPGDVIEYLPRVLQVKIITLSDRASRGEYEDRSGPLLKQLIEEFFVQEGRHILTEIRVLPDEPVMLEALINKYVQDNTDIIFTTGGTGIGPRDITPDVIRPMLTREIPGIMEMIRVKYGMQFPNALVSRGIAGVIGRSLIYALPGSPKAVKEYTEEIMKTFEHSLHMLYGIDSHE